jgi:hypothetical protein
MNRALYPIVFIIFLGSCTIERRIYSPTQVNNPALQNAGDYTIASAYSSPSGVDINSGYAITNRIAIIGGLNFYGNKDNEEDFDILSATYDSAVLTYKYTGFHAGAGGFFPISKDKETVFLSFFAGYIKNKFRMKESLFQGSSNPSTVPKLNFYNSNINRWFIQSAVNFYPKGFHIALASRLNFAAYDDVMTDYTVNEQSSYNLPPNGYPRVSTFLDFSFEAKYFFNKAQTLGVQTFFSITNRLNRKDFNFYYYPFRTGIGLVLKKGFMAPKKDK